MYLEILIVLLLALFVVLYRRSTGEKFYKYVSRSVADVYNKYAPYSFKIVREKTKELGQEYTVKQYTIQVVLLAGGAAIISYLYFYNIIVSIIYAVIAVMFIPYLAYLRCKRVYSEFIFEQIQVYATNVIMEFNTTQSFVKSLEGVRDSGVLEDPVLSDVKQMISIAYNSSTIDSAIDYMNSKYDYYVIRNMHQLFLQITNEGSKDSGEALESMMQDIDMLVENVYRDRMDRQNFHKRFLMFGVVLYFLVALVQILLGSTSYMGLISLWYVRILLHLIIIINTYFLLSGEKYYNEDVGVE
ncbi:MAG: hypothetical protein MR779_00310 [Tenericutes bacterium]|nr:hypothetical protein [Mycoplasmatota bacterium]